MWWIAACLGALLWLLVVRIKLKEKERQARRAEGSVQSDAQGRKVFVESGFLPVAARYLEDDVQVAAVLLMIGYFAWDDKPSEVHMEVLPVRTAEGQWPALAMECLWVKRGADSKLSFEPPQSHWERLTQLEPWLEKLACFAEGNASVPATTASLEDYRIYAWVRRDGEGVELEVVGEPSQ